MASDRAAAFDGPAGSDSLSMGQSADCSVRAEGEFRSVDGHHTPAIWSLAEEVAIGFSYNGVTQAVMMATPADLKDFAVGFSLAEELVASAAAIRAILVEPVTGGIRLEMTVPEADFAGDRLRERSVAGRSGCGLCGVEKIENAVRESRRVARGFTLEMAAVGRALEALPGLQVMNRVNHSVHAAAACDPAGNILLVREDVGRHNALDKLIGAMARAGVPAAETFVVLTSRCSFEMVQKAAAAGVPHLVSMSAPTSLARDLAARAGISLTALRGADGFMVFDAAHERKGTDGNP